MIADDRVTHPHYGPGTLETYDAGRGLSVNLDNGAMIACNRFVMSSWVPIAGHNGMAWLELEPAGPGCDHCRAVVACRWAAVTDAEVYEIGGTRYCLDCFNAALVP